MNQSHKLLRTGTLLGAIAIAGCTTVILAADLKSEVKDAAKMLGGKPNYSWTSESKSEGGRGQMGPTTGMTEKGGFTCLVTKRSDDTTVESLLKGEKFAVKTQEGWKSGEELRAQAQGGGGGQGAGRAFLAARLRNFKAPAAEVEAMVEKVKELTKGEGGAYSGDFTEEGVKDLLTFGRRGGDQAPPPPTGAKGWVKFWIKDGMLAKYEYNVQGKVTFGQQERDVNRTTTVEIKDVGTTKVQAPDEAKKLF
jgi:hypothetical protein